MSPRYFGPRPVEYKGIAFGLEKLAHIHDELLNLAALEWVATGDEDRFGAFEPDVFKSLRYERDTGLLVFTVRDLPTFLLRGYFICTLSSSLKQVGELVANEVAIYLAPPVRRGLAASKFLGYIEEYLGAKGVHRLVLSHRPESRRIGLFYQRKGYAPICVSYSKVLTNGTSEEIEARKTG